ncbi:MAG: phenylalanine--tRNA ligase subunit beta [Clostridia bacterium]|nr:phenylalanine--tRNA ligase subunit beta [Clostridia bacterium]
MKLPVSWIREYADIPVTIPEYRQRMVMSGTAVEDVAPLTCIEGVVVGIVLTADAVEGSRHLHLCRVDAGGGRTLQIVCGAPNVKPGIRVPTATDGAKLPGDMTISAGLVRGILSEGMLCSAAELHVPAYLYPSCGEEGLLILQEDAEAGMDVRPLLGLEDTVIDFEILANRPDCLCATGIARETAVVMGTAFQPPDITVHETGGDICDLASVEVMDADLCPRFTSRIIQNVRVGPSPMWIRKRLHAAGIRAINNIVDITNYVMLETGHPMHAYDFNKVRGGKIIVRRACEREVLETLDEKHHQLSGGELLICDAEGPIGLAGVMGGLESEITADTHTILFECAAFDRTSVRLTSRGLGVRTESSGRFERGVNPRSCADALNRACHLINLLDAGNVVSGMIDSNPNPEPPAVITASVQKIIRRTGADIPSDSVVQLLSSLSFQVSAEGDTIKVIPPPFRMDIDGEADLAEEVLRLFGYDAIPSAIPRGLITRGGLSRRMKITNTTAGVLAALGYFEMMNSSFQSIRTIEKLCLGKDDPRTQPLAIRNPLGEDTGFMRSSLLPDMLRSLALNMNRQTEAAQLYEIASTFDGVIRTEEGLPRERSVLCMGRYGAESDFYQLRTDCEMLLTRFGIPFAIVSGADTYYHPGRSCRLMTEGRILCSLGEIHPDIRDAFELRTRAYAAEFDFEALALLYKPMGHAAPLPRFPAVTRDLAVVMDEQTPLGPVLEAMREAGGALMESCDLFDVYRGAQLLTGKKSVAFSIYLRAEDRTLTDAETQTVMDNLTALLQSQYGAVIRA